MGTHITKVLARGLDSKGSVKTPYSKAAKGWRREVDRLLVVANLLNFALSPLIIDTSQSLYRYSRSIRSSTITMYIHNS